jgi:hypothetical protein
MGFVIFDLRFVISEIVRDLDATEITNQKS